MRFNLWLALCLCLGVTVSSNDQLLAGDETISTVAGTFPGEIVMDDPHGIAVDSSGIVYIADKKKHVLRKYDPMLGFSIIAGTGSAGYTGDGGAATDAKLDAPHGVAVDSSGNVYLAMKNNHVIRKVDAATGNISTIAGMGSDGYTGDGGPATSAQLGESYGVAVDASGDIYIAD